MMIIVNTDDDGASGSMIWALANHHSSSQVDSAETAGRQNCTEPYRHRHSYTVKDMLRHRHTERESCKGKDRPRNRPKPHRDTHTETQFTIHHWFDRSVGHSHFNLSQTRLNVEIISDLLSLKIKIRSDCVYLYPHSQRSHSLENGGMNNKCIKVKLSEQLTASFQQKSIPWK